MADWMATIAGGILHFIVQDVPDDVSASQVAETVREADLLFAPPEATRQDEWDQQLTSLSLLAGPRDRTTWERLRNIVDTRNTVLSSVYNIFQEQGDWPTYQYVDRVVHQTHGLGLSEALRFIPSGWVVGAESRREDERVSLSVPALASIPNARDDVELFIQFLRWAVEEDDRYIPASPTVFEPLTVTSENFRKAQALSGNSLSDQELARLYRIVQSEPQIIQDSSYDQLSARWTLVLSSGIRVYREAKTIDHYIRVRPVA